MSDAKALLSAAEAVLPVLAVLSTIQRKVHVARKSTEVTLEDRLPLVGCERDGQDSSRTARMSDSMARYFRTGSKRRRGYEWMREFSGHYEIL